MKKSVRLPKVKGKEKGKEWFNRNLSVLGWRISVLTPTVNDYSRYIKTAGVDIDGDIRVSLTRGVKDELRKIPLNYQDKCKLEDLVNERFEETVRLALEEKDCYNNGHYAYTRFNRLVKEGK